VTYAEEAGLIEREPQGSALADADFATFVESLRVMTTGSAHDSWSELPARQPALLAMAARSASALGAVAFACFVCIVTFFNGNGLVAPIAHAIGLRS
jgi:hypothetical protein